jgi:ribosomal protein S18 acetylase RimI-like enzyme
VNFEPFDAALLPQLMQWFPDARSLSNWGGPHFRYPYDDSTFRQDAGVDSLPSWMVVEGGSRRLLAFGQYYARVGRCHLGHLAVAPEMRAQGIGTHLIRQLCWRGAAALRLDEFSLFVLIRNQRAASLYRRLGFEPMTYPAPLPASEPMLYMVAAGEAARVLQSVT